MFPELIRPHKTRVSPSVFDIVTFVKNVFCVLFQINFVTSNLTDFDHVVEFEVEGERHEHGFKRLDDTTCNVFELLALKNEIQDQGESQFYKERTFYVMQSRKTKLMLPYLKKKRPVAYLKSAEVFDKNCDAASSRRWYRQTRYRFYSGIITARCNTVASELSTSTFNPCLIKFLQTIYILLSWVNSVIITKIHFTVAK